MRWSRRWCPGSRSRSPSGGAFLLLTSIRRLWLLSARRARLSSRRALAASDEVGSTCLRSMKRRIGRTLEPQMLMRNIAGMPHPNYGPGGLSSMMARRCRFCTRRRREGYLQERLLHACRIRILDYQICSPWMPLTVTALCHSQPHRRRLEGRLHHKCKIKLLCSRWMTMKTAAVKETDLLEEISRRWSNLSTGSSTL